MQINSVYLYSNIINAYTNPLDSLTAERYRRVYNRNLKIYRSVDNRIDLQLRNADQKALSISNSTLVFNLIGRDDSDLLVKKDLTLIPDNTELKIKGRAYVIFSAEEMQDFEEGHYQYSIVQEVREQITGTEEYRVLSKTPLYIDSQYGVLATIEVSGDVEGTVQNSLLIDTFNYTATFEDAPNFYISSIINAQPQLGTAQSSHTFQFYTTNYTGTIQIQGSLDAQGATPRDESWVELLSFTPASSVDYKTVEGKYNWFRIKHLPTRYSTAATFTIAQTILLDYNVSIGNAGKGYEVGAQFLFKGSTLGGETPTNDLTITVTSVDEDGAITGIDWEGLSYNGVKTFVLTATESSTGTVDKVLYR